jgi:pimeloyl-ACP methyl ester carboxylesterase
MFLDDKVLAGYARREDKAAGIAEEFLQPVLGGVRSVAVLSRPLAQANPLGFVICHSFGIEQIHLGRHEVTVARALTAAGFPVLRYQGAGYGDSEGDMRDVGLASHLAEARDAVALLAAQDGVEEIAAYGARFGALVAALTAEREGLARLAVWDPIVNGASFMRGFLRAHVFFEMSESKGEGEVSGVEQLLQDLEAQGWADVKGFRLSRQAYEEIGETDLSKDLVNFKGAALVGSVTKQGRPTPAAKSLSAHLRGIGARVVEESVADPWAAEFGHYHYHARIGHDGAQEKADTQVELTDKIAGRTVTWGGNEHESLREEA